MAKTYLLVMFDNGKSGMINAIKKVVSEKDYMVLSKDANAAVYAMKGKEEFRYQIISKKVFDFQFGENLVVFIVCDVKGYTVR